MGRYRLKKHGVTDFWDWVASWARCYETPADLGYDIPGFVLPELKIIRHQAMGDVRPPAGALFLEDLSATNIHDVKRQTAKTRAEKVAELIDAEPDEQWLIFCDTDYEAVELRSVLPGAIEVKGSMPPELKERNIERFLQDRVHMISKPSIMGMGLNLQHVARMAYVGRTFSYESYYQSVRRCWRYGQKRPVYVHIVVAEGEDQIGRVIDRKAESHREMKAAMSAAMRRALAQSREVKIKYNPQHIGRFPKWLKSA
jgi:superfamily II DNA/RNA helicase